SLSRPCACAGGDEAEAEAVVRVVEVAASVAVTGDSADRGACVDAVEDRGASSVLETLAVDLAAAVEAEGVEAGFSHDTSTLWEKDARVFSPGVTPETETDGDVPVCAMTSNGCCTSVSLGVGLRAVAGVGRKRAVSGGGFDFDARRRMRRTTRRPRSARSTSPPTTPPTIGPVLDLDLCWVGWRGRWRWGTGTGTAS
ncbi:hypothetical protein B0H12DRAFT_1120468, partial [Mycena haematopus]